MPWKWVHVHFDAPKDPALPILADLPEGFTEDGVGGLLSVNRIAHNRVWEMMYHCHWCGGWIPGEPNEYTVNTLESEHLSGRRGREFYCRRCGREIGFRGVMS